MIENRVAPRPSLPMSSVVDPKPRWKAQHYLAAFGVLFLLYQAWTYGAWLLDGPYQITATRDVGSASWYAARVYEAVMVVVSAVLAVRVVRGCLRARRLTTDAMICIAGAFGFWADPLFNWAQPIWFYSSNWTNVNSWCSHMPGVVNPSCGLMPEPTIFIGLSYVFGLLLFAMIVNAAMRAAQRRWPGMSAVQLVALVLPVAAAIDMVFETPMYKLHLWEYPGAPNWVSLFPSSATKYPLVEVLVTTATIMGVAVLRFFKDDQGRTLPERGRSTRPSARGTALSQLAWIGSMNLILVLLGNVGGVAVGPYSDPYRPQPSGIVNGICDFPGVTGTAYGPCPGDPSYRAPMRRYPNPKSTGKS